MKIIGRRLTVAFAENTFIRLEKRFVKPDLFKGEFKNYEKDAYLENVVSILGEDQYRLIGSPIGPQVYGMDVNHLISDNGCWITQEEYEKMYEHS